MIGLTGGIATGKSTVSSLLQSQYGLPVIDADTLARKVVEPGSPGLRRIVQTFGTEVLLTDGSGALDRKKLGSIIFNDEKKRKQLNAIVHPAVRWAMFWGVVKCWLRGEKICVLDVPLLIESKIWSLFNGTLVLSPPDIQIERLMNRDKSSKEDAMSRINSQLPIHEKLDYADYVVVNDSSLKDLEDRLSSVVQRLRAEAGWTWRLTWFPPLGILSAVSVLAYRLLWVKIPVKKR
ncbi:CoaE-domain-containing protein [Marasmius fiardii PR-910]|nr:CoaE-domain-containing protein [Marasmius fiardii PR-910]